jgi:hypothetical protein
MPDPPDFIKELLAGTYDKRLDPDQQAFLDAWLRTNPVSWETIQREKKQWGRSPADEAQQKLRCIARYNRNLQRGMGVAAKPDTPAAPPGPLDDFALAKRLRETRRGKQADIVDFMRGKARATFEELADHVWPKEKDVSDARIRGRINALIDSAQLENARSVYSQGEGHIYRVDRTQTSTNPWEFLPSIIRVRPASLG